MTATRRSPRRTGGRKTQPTKRASGRRPTKKTASNRGRAARPQPGPISRLLTALAAASRGHGFDFAGLAMAVIGVIAGLGVYGRAGGPVGRFVADATGALLGAARIIGPPIFLIVGILLIRGAPEPRSTADDDDRDRPAHPIARIVLGAGLLAIAALGALHLLRDAPPFGSSRTVVADSAGYLGQVIGEPLNGALGTFGAALVLAAVAAAGALVVTRTTIRSIAERTAAGVVAGARPVGGAARRMARNLFELDGSNRTGEAVTSPGEEGLDVGGALEQPEVDEPVEEEAPAPKPKRRRRTKLDESDADAEPPEQLSIALPGSEASNWKLPPSSLLERSGSQAVDRQLVEDTGRRLEHALAEHGVETRLIGMTVGPTVTRYELELGPGVKVARVTSLHKDIAYAMATPDVRILAPIPGKQAIGVEIPNVRKQLVTVGDILTSSEARAATHPLEVAVGRDIDGKAIMMNLASMPHLLIAGATGAGKSSCLNSVLTSILMRSTPDQVRMILVDPKRVEMGQYNKLPHLLTEVVTVPKKAANALAWAVREMERRYDVLAECGFRDITGYNAAVASGELNDPNAELLGEDAESVTTYEAMPFILVVIDELADLMMVAARDVEESIARLAQMARAVGIHLVIATQRPSVNVITGLIKANVPARMAFAVSSSTDSRVILDQVGAERLLGKGDLLLLGPSSSIPQRIQGSWVTEDETRTIAAFWKRQTPELDYSADVQGADEEPKTAEDPADITPGSDGDLLQQATELVVRSQLGSTSMLQRKLRIGFARAGRLMDELEEKGVVGPSIGSKARDVMMTVEELEGGGQGGGGDDLDE